ncbi:MAG TPA: SDR family oxidoreductase [Candidatus Wujingus californicus]|uniref:SDR family oxidoreductase n=1 Tax=Candidatus Wujingus californicus TaxID=3367618 RepID=UPI001D2AC717|nr:SDR family oxidoreductase [Planctomycetota bacterium]MDO8131048.1 SDR family oxidoreductase [Candidatus Brocadiales bacterium]
MNYNKLFNMSDEVVLQIGFTGPIGRQFSSILAESGCSLILGDVNEEEGGKIVHNLKEINGKIEYVKIDVADEQGVREMVKYVSGKYGRISVLVNAFSKRPTDFNKKFEDSDFKSWTEVMEVNLSAMYLVCREISKIMIIQRQGSIVNVASFLGVVAPDQRVYGGSGLNSPAVYTASKSGVIGLTKYLATYLGKYNIRVNCISPGGVNPGGVDKEFEKNYSAKVPLERMGNMDDMKGPLIFLASKASQYVNGHNLVVDGGMTVW